MESEERTPDPKPRRTAETYLTELPREPSAVPGCSTCLSLSVSRGNARSVGDYSGVSDSNVRLRQHQRDEHTETAASTTSEEIGTRAPGGPVRTQSNGKA
ncbi:hypothetical protein DVK44_11270 [Streptomyces paludis]|uniref:Uncharacterized protein n=1 Tax=Streptomyces paludis TaxID=2282738 RepID=A0A345HNB8_9ACTN|nr:hypothetical protein DVK44_11270 [Streptomyces paludis]